MTQREWFDIGVRLVGVVVLVFGIWDLVYAWLFYADYFRNPDSSFRFHLIAGWCSIALGLILIRAASVIVNFAYGPEDEEVEAEESVSDKSD
ncbi:MAG: hypothetical protein ACT4O9_01475 [Blastocatellia bacterium]